jgi:GTP-binding protein EngB required for normal cell division
MKFRFDLPRGNFPRLVLIGNSNVGKSSLTRLLLTRPELYKGKIGKTPGSTLRLTIINDPHLPYHVIDLPGFGKMLHSGHNIEADIQEQILNYLKLDAHNIFLLIVVISSERIEDELEKWFFQNEESIPLSIEFLQLAVEFKIPSVIVLNKADKINELKRSILHQKLAEVLTSFQISVLGADADTGLLGIIDVSTIHNTGIKELKSIIQHRITRIDLSKYDSRDNYKQLPVIGHEKESDSKLINVSKKKSKSSDDDSKISYRHLIKKRSSY